MSNIWLIQPPHSVPNWAASFLLVQSWIGLGQIWNTPAWSLSAEWFAHLVFPVLAWAAWQLRSAWLAGALAAASLSLLATLTFVRYGSTAYGKTDNLGLLRCACEFSAGMLVFRLADIAPQVRRWSEINLFAGFSLLASVLLVKQMDWPAPFAFALIVLACWGESRTANLLFGNRLIAWLGEISFSLYIGHWLLIECAFGLLAGGPHGSRDPGIATAAVVLALVTAVPIATLLYRYVERPSHRLGRYVLRRERG